MTGMEGGGSGGGRLPCKNHSHNPPGHHGYNWPDRHEHKDLPKEQDHLPFVQDHSNFDIVKATQYGLLERCQELIEAGYDVRQPDKENITLLHWAAINNRLELAKFFISKGAIVDQLGGDLNSTPLHWAIRQGHLSMVILLLKFGADPALIDGEGYSSLHLAVLFQHMPIIAYLISYGQSIDTTDHNGQTPLMLAAHKVLGLDPTRFLLKFNPSLNAVDNIEKNTALHCAIAAGNVSAVDLFLEAGSSLDIKNIKGDTPLDLAHQTQHRLIIHLITEEGRMRARKNSRLQRILGENEFLLLLVMALIVTWAIGYVVELNSDSWLLKGSLLLFICVIISLFARQFVGFNKLKYFPVAFLFGSMFWISVTCFIWFLPDFSGAVSQFPFFFGMVWLLYYFYKMFQTDPGYIKTTEEERKKNIITLAESGSLDFRTFCTSCLVKKPLRSMHCHSCNSCVARYDQHCIWIGQCIGVGNHRYFVLFLLFLTMVNIWALYGTVLYWSEHCTVTYQKDGAWISFTQIISCSPWVSYIFTLVSFHTSWASLLLALQLYQVVFLGLTSHERITLWRQNMRSKHPVSLRKTPYNHGCLQNMADFFQCRCFGMLKPNIVDWTKQYAVTFHSLKDKNIHPV
ncbi:palmitoyltransferase ZDHHC13 isoform X4 [Sphaerodactylus townsendi]|uniref:palmitoyltransferase ZDHHC13 isoform X4 n=1 Tax=Sphaerodactylus townsendi TaxID=933632 RepID=UPI00202741C6|nr:palmitoyltransferase ZDHHC13 isoform X4 [Sphaerodactylus townsendi]